MAEEYAADEKLFFKEFAVRARARTHTHARARAEREREREGENRPFVRVTAHICIVHTSSLTFRT